MTTDAWLTLGIAVVAIALFASEIVTVDLAALAVMGALLAFGLVTPEQGVSGFSNSATVTVLAMFILSAGLQRSGVVERVSRLVVPLARGSEARALVLLMALVIPLSAFINNTAAVVLLMPVALDLARAAQSTPSKFLIPLSYGSIIGGLVTLVGTSTNLLASSISERLGFGRFGMFEFAVPGLLIALGGVTFIVVVVRPMLPRRGTDPGQRFELDEYIAEFEVSPQSPIAGRHVRDIANTAAAELRILHHLPRDSREPTGASVDGALVEPGDRLLVAGAKDRVISGGHALGLVFKNRSDEGARSRLSFYEVVVTPQAHLVGRTLREARFAERYGGSVVAIRRRHRILRDRSRISAAHLGAGDALLVAATTKDVERWRVSQDLMLVEMLDAVVPDRVRFWSALSIFAGVVLAATFGLADIMVAALVGATVMALSGVLKMSEFHDAIRWDVIFLLAGLIPLGIAVETSGLAAVLADALGKVGGMLPPLLLLVLFHAITSLLTEILSNAACVVLLLPIAAATAVKLDLEPRTFILVVCSAASCGFMTPFGYQTHAIVYGPGGYRFRDYLRVGLPMDLLLTVLSPLLIAAFFPLR